MEPPGSRKAPLARRAAVRAGLQLGGIAFWGYPRPVKFDDALEVLRWRSGAARDRLHEGVFVFCQDPDALAHLRQGCADRLPVERYGHTSVPGHDERLWAKGEDTPQGAVELVRLLAGGFRRGVRVGTAHRRQEERVTGEEGSSVQEVARALGSVPRRP